jgi:sterol desaturase/sphingolipid hydroxylase (fatty acid hydroxylase superfamily)
VDALLTRSPAWLAVVLGLVLVEVVWRVRSGRGYDRRNALTTLGLAAGNIPAAILNGLVIGAVFAAAWKIAPIHLPMNDWKTWVAGFIAVEFAYYWFHRASHRVRWLWATHAVHHSPEEMTLLSSLRLGWTNLLSAGWVLYMPLVFVGFDPRLIVLLLALDLRYQFFLHTEAKLSFGPLERLLNTPSHHRAHHGRNEIYLDCNYGGVIIIFDRMFGTFRAERAEEPAEFGLKGRVPEPNPVRLAFREWRALFQDLTKAQGLRHAVRIALSPPGSDVPHRRQTEEVAA